MEVSPVDVTITAGNGITLESELENTVREVLARLASDNGVKPKNGSPKVLEVRLGVSSRHMHLCREDVDKLFGKGYELKPFKDLYQKGYFAAQERVLVVGKRRCIEDVRVLGPLRKFSQVELSQTDAVSLGLQLNVAEHGGETVSQPIILVGPKGQVYLPGGEGGGAYIARRHLHLDSLEAAALGIKNGDTIKARSTGERAITFHNVLIRTNPGWSAEMHLDTDEANAAGLRTGDMLTLELP
jgi:putative phosphotransacetylase